MHGLQALPHLQPPTHHAQTHALTHYNIYIYNTMGTNIQLIYLYVHKYICKARPAPPPPLPPSLANPCKHTSTPAHKHDLLSCGRGCGRVLAWVRLRAGVRAGACECVWADAGACVRVPVCMRVRAGVCARHLVPVLDEKARHVVLHLCTCVRVRVCVCVRARS